VSIVGCGEIDARGLDCRGGVLRLWETFPSIDAILAEAAQRAGRVLTADECGQYLHVEQCP
jgi:hypothetical protein